MARFHTDWKMNTFVLLLLPLVIALGVWQLQRADYKRGLEDAYFDQLGALPQPMQAQQPADFARVRVAGRYLEPHYLLDNQINSGNPGYWVYTPFDTGAAGVVLVNRGWVAGGASRSDALAVPPTPSGEVSLVALVWPDTGALPGFGTEALEVLSPQLVRVQRLDWEALMPEFDLRTLELRLEAGQPGVFDPAPQQIQFGIERHMGYAVQWFGLAIALIACFFFYGRRHA